MSNIKNGGLDQYGAGPLEQQQFGTAGIERVNSKTYRFRGIVNLESSQTDYDWKWISSYITTERLTVSIVSLLTFLSDCNGRSKNCCKDQLYQCRRHLDASEFHSILICNFCNKHPWLMHTVRATFWCVYSEQIDSISPAYMNSSASWAEITEIRKKQSVRCE